MPRVILSGGPGVGKTNLLRERASLGCAVIDESARELIRERLTARLPPRPGALEFAGYVLEVLSQGCAWRSLRAPSGRRSHA